MVTITRDNQLLLELQSLRRTVDELKSCLNYQHRVALRPAVREAFWGQPVTISAKVTDVTGAFPKANVPVTFVASRGKLRSSDGYTSQQGQSVAAYTNSEGTARVTLLPSFIEEQWEAQHGAMQEMLSKLEAFADTPRDAEISLREMANAYDWSVNQQYCRALDICFRDFEHRFVNAVNPIDQVKSWRALDSTIAAFAGDAHCDEQSGGSIQGAAQTTIRFKEWIGPLVQTFLDLSKDRHTLDKVFHKIKRDADDEATLIDGIYECALGFVSSQRGILGSYAARKAAASAIKRFVESGMDGLTPEVRIAVISKLRALSQMLTADGSMNMAAIGNSLASTNGAKLVSRVTKDDLNEAITRATLGLVNREELDSVISGAISEGTKNLVANSSMNAAIENATSDTVNREYVSSAINSSIADATRDLASRSEVGTSIEGAIRDLVSLDSMADAIAQATRGLASQTAIDEAVGNAIREAAHDLVTLSSAAVEAAINEATRSLPAREEVQSTVEAAISSAIQNLASRDEMSSSIDNAVRDLVDRENMNAAIETAVTDATRNLVSQSVMNAAIETSLSDPSKGLVTEDSMRAAIESSVNEATRGLISRAAMEAAIDIAAADATRHLVKQSDMREAIEQAVNDSSRGLVNRDAMNSAIEIALGDATRNLVSQAGMKTAIENALNDPSKGLVTRDGVQAAIETAIADTSANLVSRAAMNAAIERATSSATQGFVTHGSMDSAIEEAVSNATRNLVSRSVVNSSIEAIVNDPTKGLVNQDGMYAAIEAAIREATENLVSYAVMNSSINAAVGNLVDRASLNMAISKALRNTVAQDSVEIVTSEVNMNPVENIDPVDRDIMLAITLATSGLVSGDDMTEAIASATSEIRRKVTEIESSVGRMHGEILATRVDLQSLLDR